MLNIGSFLLGIVAWSLPIVYVFKGNKHNHGIALTTLSMTACAISLCFQILNFHHLVNIGDWTAIMDISGGIVLAAAVLLIVTILLNGMALMVYRIRVQN